eukprot:tig00000852_g5033.t1
MVSCYNPYFGDTYRVSSSAPDRLPCEEPGGELTYCINQGNKKSMYKLACESPRGFSAMRSPTERFPKAVPFLDDARCPCPTLPYTTGLGPGSYDKGDHGLAIREPRRPSSMFRDGRTRFSGTFEGRATGETNYTLDWDAKEWTRKGFFMSRRGAEKQTEREKEKGKGAVTLASLGLEAQDPDRDRDPEQGSKASMVKALRGSMRTYSVMRSKAPRFPTLASYKDPRLLVSAVAKEPYELPIGPGYYRVKRRY